MIASQIISTNNDIGIVLRSGIIIKYYWYSQIESHDLRAKVYTRDQTVYLYASQRFANTRDYQISITVESIKFLNYRLNR